MDWRDAPAGMMRYEELLNALLATWKTQFNISSRHNSNADRIYEIGFEEGLDAVAQAAGLDDHFEAGKARYRARLRERTAGPVKLVEPRASLIDSR